MYKNKHEKELMAAIPSVVVSDPFQASVSERVYSHKVAQPPIRSEWKLFKPQGTFLPGQSQATFNIFPPSNTTIVDKRFLVRLGFSVATSPTATVGARNFFPTGTLRSFPVNNVISQSNIVINGAGGFVTQTNEVTYVMKQFIGLDEANFYQTPTQTDATPNFETAYGILADHVQSSTPADPFFGYTVNGYDNDASPLALSADMRSQPRGCFPSESPNNNEGRWMCTEALMNGVLGAAGDQEGFVNVSKLDITLTFDTNLVNCLWSSFGLLGAANQGITGDIFPICSITSCEVLCHFITPSITSVPSVFTTDYKQYVLNSQSNQNVIPYAASDGTIGASGLSNFTNLTLNTVPEFLYIFVRPPKPHFPLSGEFVARIKKISINLGTSFGHLSQLDEHTLFLMSRDNGYKGRNFAEWVRMGSFLCIDCAKDLGLVPGQNRYLPIDFSIDVAFPYQGALIPDAAAGTCTINLLAVVQGAVSIEPDRCTSILGFSSIEQANALGDNSITETSLVKDMGTNSGMGQHGGKLSWGGVWRAIKTGIRHAAPVANAIAGATGNPYARAAAQGLDMASNMVGSGMHSRKRGRGLLLG
jgi:hypothetical protein